MDLISKNGYLVCKPYKLPEGSSGLLIGKNSDCFAKVYSRKSDSSFKNGDVVWYDKTYSRECIIAGETYIAIDERNVIALLKEV